MTPTEIKKNRRILIVDDNQAIHHDFRKILEESVEDSSLDQDEAFLFGGKTAVARCEPYEVHSAYQGEEALEMTKAAFRKGSPYAVAFVDVRMPPGWDGVETIEHLWEEDPGLHVVICTAYSDYSWDEVVDRLGITDRLLILKKPFDRIQVRQIAAAFIEKWHLARQSRLKRYEMIAWGGGILDKTLAEHGDGIRIEQFFREVWGVANELVRLAAEMKGFQQCGTTQARTDEAIYGKAVLVRDGLGQLIDIAESAQGDELQMTGVSGE